MDITEAKQLLSSYHSDKDHFSDPHMLEALNMLEKNSELADWFEHQLAFDRQVKAALSEAPEPAGLRDKLLQNHKQTKRNNVIRCEVGDHFGSGVDDRCRWILGIYGKLQQ